MNEDCENHQELDDDCDDQDSQQRERHSVFLPTVARLVPTLSALVNATEPRIAIEHPKGIL
jgi:hypothetical protein